MADSQSKGNHPQFKDMSGMKFGLWTVLHRVDYHLRKPHWLCRCECGAQRSVMGGNLRCGKSTNCGCLQAQNTSVARSTHGKSKDPAYSVWSAMKARCHRKTCSRYEDYGARGIFVYTGWRKSFTAFLAYVGPRPSLHHTIERIDVNRGYEPGNVCWILATDQAKNTRRTIKVIHHGVEKSLEQAMLNSGSALSKQTIRKRLSLGWPLEDALHTETDPHRPHRPRSAVTGRVPGRKRKPKAT